MNHNITAGDYFYGTSSSFFVKIERQLRYKVENCRKGKFLNLKHFHFIWQMKSVKTILHCIK